MNNSVLKISLLILFLAAMSLAKAQPANQVQLVSELRDKAYDRVHIDDHQPIAYPYLRESDVFWEKRVWRVIDLKEKINQPLYFPEIPQGRWRSMMQILYDALLGGEITAYEYTLATDNFEELIPMTASQMEATLADTITVPVPDPNDPNNFINERVAREFEPKSVTRFLVKEDWIFDKQRSEMQIRILGICPMRPAQLEDGTFAGYENLFWLYYPDIRPLLARFEVFNRRNSASRLTYDEMLLSRRFGSYIVKEDNVYNREIQEYAKGVDALLEAERIKEDIRDFESELWVY